MLNNPEVISLIAIVIAVIGTLILLLVGVFEKLLKNAVGAAIILGLALEVLAVIFGILSWRQPLGVLATILAYILLLWCGVSFKLYQNWIRRRKQESKGKALDHDCPCVPKLVLGTSIYFFVSKRTWRTHLIGRFQVNPSDGGLDEENKFGGGAYYGLWFTSKDLIANTTVSITCELVEDKCEISASEKGRIEDQDGPVRVYTKNVIQALGNTATVTVKMGSALNASGGPQATLAAGPVSITMSWPDADLTAVNAMGTYKWRCKKKEDSK